MVLELVNLYQPNQTNIQTKTSNNFVFRYFHFSLLLTLNSSNAVTLIFLSNANNK